MLLPVLERAAAIVGSMQKLADAIGAKRSTMYEWDAVPAEYVLPIEKAQRDAWRNIPKRIVTRHDIRPDLYPRKQKSKRRALA